MVNYSLGEIDSLCRKATRGAGFSWGMAEEVGKAVRWLAAYDLEGPKMLAHYLEYLDEHAEVCIPEYRNGVYTHQENVVCPLFSGTIINDFAYRINNKESLSFNRMLFPLLALPHAGRVSQALDIFISMDFADGSIVCSPKGICVEETTSMSTCVADVVCQRVDKIKAMTHTPKPQSRALDDKTLQILEASAHKTYAPATEASRLLGAGAGVTDND